MDIVELTEKKESTGKKIVIGVCLILVAALVAVVFRMTFVKLQQDLYEERAYNAIQVMEGASAHLETIMQTHLDHASFDAGLIAERKFSEEEEILSYLETIQKMHGSKEDGLLFLVDDRGNCHAPGGSVFRWGESGALNSTESMVLISSVNALKLFDEQMLFLTPLPKKVEVGDISFSYLCVVMDMSSIARYFETVNYHDESTFFIILDDGTYVYKQTSGDAFSKVFNLIARLEGLEYRYQTSAEQTIGNIRNHVNGCACVVVDGENYFVVHDPLDVNDWTAVLLVPERQVRGNTTNFMSSIVISTAILAVIAMVTILGIVILNHRQTKKRQALINEQLRRAAEAERSANEAKTRFLSSMSHDIRTPMNAIIGMTTIAEKYAEDPAQVRDCLAKINLAGNHLITLINDILDISKIESGKILLNPVTFSLADSVNNLFNIVRPQIRTKEQEFDIHIDKIDYEYLIADELRLNQIYINILTNAVKYTPKWGRIDVTLKEELLEGDPKTVKLTYIVKDNGIGMTEEFMENMYGSFSRATDSRVDKIQGSGLGLSICKQLVDLMKGTIECESTLGVGTTFTITLVLPVAEQPAEAVSLPGVKLLLVEDDELFQETAADMLREMEIEVDLAETGEQAISMVEKLHGWGQDYSVILVDWKLPGIDGIETIQELGNRVEKKVPLVLISSYDSADIEQAATAAGAVGFIRKPFFKASLCQQLTQFLHTDIHSETGAEDGFLDLSGMRILVAEDNDLNWEIAQEILEMAGIGSERAENGQICLDRLLVAEDGEFDLVLMDVQMPVMNGREATREIREQDREYVKNIPVLAMTADAFMEDINACMEAGMNGHVAKPIDMKKLFGEIRRVTKK